MAKFKKGQSGNPAGKPKGAVNHRTIILNALKAKSTNEEEFAQMLHDRAKDGCAASINVLASRIWKPSKPQLDPVVLPDADTKEQHALNVIAGLSTGDITPDQASTIMHVLRQAAELTEIQELLERIRALEEEC